MSPRNWRILGAVAAALVLVVGWFAVIEPSRSATQELQLQTAQQEQSSQQLRSRISLLKKQNEEIPAQQAILASVQKKMPTTSSVPTLIRSLTAAAATASVTMASLTPERPVPISVPQTAPEPPADAEGADESASDAEGDVEAAAPSTTPGQARVQRLPLSITVCGSFAELRRYLSELEKLKRVMTVDRLSISRGACAGSDVESDLTASVSSSVFILPPADPSTAAGGAASASGASASTEGAPS